MAGTLLIRNFAHCPTRTTTTTTIGAADVTLTIGAADVTLTIGAADVTLTIGAADVTPSIPLDFIQKSKLMLH